MYLLTYKEPRPRDEEPRTERRDLVSYVRYLTLPYTPKVTCTLSAIYLRLDFSRNIVIQPQADIKLFNYPT